MFEVRRGAENLCSLKKKDFRLMKDKVYDFSYWKKVCFLRFLCLKKQTFSFLSGTFGTGQEPPRGEFRH